VVFANEVHILRIGSLDRIAFRALLGSDTPAVVNTIVISIGIAHKSSEKNTLHEADFVFYLGRHLKKIWRWEDDRTDRCLYRVFDPDDWSGEFGDVSQSWLRSELKSYFWYGFEEELDRVRDK
jgi:hypothetical protein